MRGGDDTASGSSEPVWLSESLRTLRGGWSAVVEAAWPQATVCGRPSGGGGYRPEAWAKIRFLEAPWCERCGQAFEHDRGPGASCAACETSPRAWDRLRAACVYGDASRELILQFKHGDRLEHAGLFVGWLSRVGRDLVAEADVVTPVPLHPLRLLKRRFNQAAELARPLARRSGVAFLPDALVRTRRGGQAGRSAGGRRREAQGAFTVPDRRRAAVEGRRVLLVDDVVTTGATADACARALKRAGAAAVDVVAVARAPNPRDITI